MQQIQEERRFDDRYMPYASALTERAREFRKNLTPAERIFWEAVRARRFRGLKFKRQKPLLEFIVDFYCAELRIVVEIDGGVHDEAQERDGLRSEELKTLGITIVRYTNDEIIHNITRVFSHLSALVDTLKRRSDFNF